MITPVEMKEVINGENNSAKELYESMEIEHENIAIQNTSHYSGVGLGYSSRHSAGAPISPNAIGGSWDIGFAAWILDMASARPAIFSFLSFYLGRDISELVCSGTADN